MNDKLPEWFSGNADDYVGLEPDPKNPVTDDEREQGILLRGPFAMEHSKKGVPSPVYGELFGYTSATTAKGDELPGIQYSDGQRMRRQGIKGRVRIEGDSVIFMSNDLGRVRVRPLTLADTKNFKRLLNGRRPKTVVEFAQFILEGDPTDG